jgi:hypothetical protein
MIGSVKKLSESPMGLGFLIVFPAPERLTYILHQSQQLARGLNPRAFSSSPLKRTKSLRNKDFSPF